MKTYNSIEKIVSDASSIGVFSHKNPDGDTVASALALVLVFRKLGKKAELVCDDALDPKLAILPKIELYNSRDINTYDAAIAVDCSELERLGGAMKLFRNAKNKVAIDHHITHVRFANVTLLEERSSTAEIVFDFLKTCYPSYIDSEIAEILFAGIITDSGGFGNSSVNSATHLAAAELLNYGFDADRIYYHFIKAHTYDTFRLKMIALPKTMFFASRQIAVVFFSQKDFKETNTDIQNTSGLLYDVINIEDVVIAVSVSEVGDKNFKISVRTKGNADAARIALAFGGGGHKRAAGFIRNGHIENVIDDIVKVCADNL